MFESASIEDDDIATRAQTRHRIIVIGAPKLCFETESQ